MDRLLRCPCCGGFHNGDDKECVLCFRPEIATVQSTLRRLDLDAVERARRNWNKIAKGFVDRIVLDGQVFERDRGWLFPHWVARGTGRHKHIEGLGSDLREANIDLLYKICRFEIRELLGCHEGPKSPTDRNLRHRKARGINFGGLIHDEKEEEGADEKEG